ncbi:MAG: hypothetical protein ABIH11_07890 [Candidatus Altiarchaeota archaeon]
MARKKKSDKPDNSGLSLGDIPFGGVFSIIESVGDLFQGYLMHKYQVEERIEGLREDTEKKLEEFRREAINTAYEAKKAFFRTIVEAILFSTGIIALILGVIMFAGTYVPTHFVLIAYGLIVTIFVLMMLKTSPEGR